MTTVKNGNSKTLFSVLGILVTVIIVISQLLWLGMRHDVDYNKTSIAETKERQADMREKIATNDARYEAIQKKLDEILDRINR